MSNLESILKSFHLQDELNPKIWGKNSAVPIMNPKVRTRLLEIANDFIEFLDVDIVVSDVIMTGSLANYNWSKFSDVDIHILVDFNQFSDEERPLYEELFFLKKSVYNDKHNITIFGYDVELYVEDESAIKEVKSIGIYSIMDNDWVSKPDRESVDINYDRISEKAKQWMKTIDSVIEDTEDTDIESAKNIIKKCNDKIRKYRESGLQKGGEYSEENLVFKILRRNGYLEKIRGLKDKLVDKRLTLKESLNNGSTLGQFSIISDNTTKGHKSRKLGNWQSDNAWDLKAPIGTTVNSFTKGVVSNIRQSKPGSSKIFGTQVSINGVNGNPDIFYTHLEGVTIKKGDKVNVGDYIGKITKWPASPSSSHVHIGLPEGQDLGDLIVKNKIDFKNFKQVSNNKDEIKGKGDNEGNLKSDIKSPLTNDKPQYNGGKTNNVPDSSHTLLGKLLRLGGL